MMRKDLNTQLVKLLLSITNTQHIFNLYVLSICNTTGTTENEEAVLLNMLKLKGTLMIAKN